MATTLNYKAKYGFTEKSVRKHLVHIDLFGHNVLVHKKEVVRFKAWEADVKAFEEDCDKGCWAPLVVQTWCWRNMRNSDTLSRHSFGIAVDIDPKTNPYNSHKHDIPDYVVALAIQNGFTWGGNWTKPCDPMHFEVKWSAPSVKHPKTLDNGSTGIWVTRLQQALKRQGISVKVDGDFGDKTEAAVRKFQKSKKLRIDGVVGNVTAHAIGLW